MKRFLSILLGLMACLTTLSAQTAAEREAAAPEGRKSCFEQCDLRTTATVMTYNVGAFSKYLEDSTPDIASLILDSGATLAGLNEVDSLNRRHMRDQAADLAAALGAASGTPWYHSFGKAMDYAGGGYGNAVVSREPILCSYTISLPKGDGSEPRSVAVVETAELVYGSVHLDYRGNDAACRQVQVLTDWFEAHYGGCGKPVILGGDMNALPGSAVLQELAAHWEQLSSAEETFSSKNPSKCIDYILALRSAAPVSVISSRVLSDPSTRTASDHLPVVVTFRY